MIDGKAFYIPGLLYSLAENIDKTITYDEHETIRCIRFKLNNLFHKIRCSKNYTEVKGSGPKFYFGHSVLNLNRYELFLVIKKLSSYFNINPFKTILFGAEFSLTCELDFDPGSFVENVILFRNKVESKNWNNNKGQGLEFTNTQYDFKIYNASIYCDNGKSYIRIKFVAKENAYLNEFNINTLGDLLVVDNLKLAFQSFFDYYDKILMYDPQIDLSKLKTTDADFLLKYRYLPEWKLNDTHRNTRAGRSKRFETILNDHIPVTRKQQVRDLLSQKLNELLLISEKEEAEILNFISECKSS